MRDEKRVGRARGAVTKGARCGSGEPHRREGAGGGHMNLLLHALQRVACNPAKESNAGG